jgi:hypothetical protein
MLACGLVSGTADADRADRDARTKLQNEQDQRKRDNEARVAREEESRKAAYEESKKRAEEEESKKAAEENSKSSRRTVVARSEPLDLTHSLDLKSERCLLTIKNTGGSGDVLVKWHLKKRSERMFPNAPLEATVSFEGPDTRVIELSLGSLQGRDDIDISVSVNPKSQ